VSTVTKLRAPNGPTAHLWESGPRAASWTRAQILGRNDKLRTVVIGHADTKFVTYGCEKGCGFQDQDKSIVESHEAGCHWTMLR
jgi:hypothetical protein